MCGPFLQIWSYLYYLYIYTDLQCQDPIIYELMQEDDVNPYQLISAQLQVVKSMEENWCGISNGVCV